jgi:hypothetical protein
VVYEGGLDEHGHPADTRTPEQREAMEDLLEDLLGRYSLAKVYTHNQLDNRKACPCFNF